MDDPREGARLTMKVDAAHWVAQYLSPLIEAGMTVADVGCGAGAILAEAARRYPACNFIGIDASQTRVKDANGELRNLGNAYAKHGTAHSLPLEDQSCDVVYSRFLFQYLSDKEAALAELRRALVPGGLLLLQDLDGQLLWNFPEDADLVQTTDEVLAALRQTGFDPFVGRKLYYLMHTADLRHISLRCEPYHFFAGRIDARNEALWSLKMDIALPLITKALGCRERAAAFCERVFDYLRRPDTLTFSLVFTATGRRPTSNAGSS